MPYYRKRNYYRRRRRYKKKASGTPWFSYLRTGLSGAGLAMKAWNLAKKLSSVLNVEKKAFDHIDTTTVSPHRS